MAVGTVVKMTEEMDDGETEKMDDGETEEADDGETGEADDGETAAATCEKLPLPRLPRDWLVEGLADAVVIRVGYVTASTTAVCKRSTWIGGDLVVVEFAILATGVVELGKLIAALCMIRGAASPKIRL